MGIGQGGDQIGMGKIPQNRVEMGKNSRGSGGIGRVYFTMSLSSLMNFTVFVVCDSVVISL